MFVFSAAKRLPNETFALKLTKGGNIVMQMLKTG
jgi:hypothetical protein